jgi:hypothetical protein
VVDVQGCPRISACRAHSFPTLILKLEFPSSRILSVPGTVANRCVESGAVLFSVVWDQLPGSRLECYGHDDRVDGKTIRGLNSLLRRQCPTFTRSNLSLTILRLVLLPFSFHPGWWSTSHLSQSVEVVCIYIWQYVEIQRSQAFWKFHE